MSDYFFQFLPSEDTCISIINKISDAAGNSLYPDILFSHDFSEKAVVSDEVYGIAREMMNRYDSSHCVFVSCNEKKCGTQLTEFRLFLENFYKKEEAPEFDEKEFNDFCNGLSLSVTLTASLKRLFVYHTLCGKSCNELIREVKQSCNLPVSKKEGKKIYEYLKNKILCK